jgi:molybdate transport system substrate-binding protein
MKKKTLLLFFLAISAFANGQDSDQILIAAASDLKFALDSVVTVFKKSHLGARIEVTYGSSGKLFEQISHTAPFDLFFSADIEYPATLKKKGIVDSEVYSYGIGRIVIWSQVIDPGKEQINSLLDKSINKVAIANPQHAPYGRRAEEALKYYKVYDKVKSKLVYGENISQTAQFVTSGAADTGIIALSLALSPTMKKLNGQYYLIPEDAHKPLKQGFVILKKAEQNALAIDFKDFMLGSEAGEILGYFGFTKK